MKVNRSVDPVNMPDLIWKCFSYSQLQPLQPVYSQNQARWYKPDPIRLPTSNSVLNFQRRHGSYCAKLTQIRSEWPGQGLAKSIWSGSKPVCRNHWAQFLAGCNQSATSFPLSDLAAFFHRCPRSYCTKPAQI